MDNSLNDNDFHLKSFPIDHSIEAFEKEYYFEAVAVLHGFIESQMKSYFHLHAANVSKESLSKGWDINDKLPYISLAHVIFVLNLIDKAEYDNLISFNTLRNELMHRYYLDPYEGWPKRISKSKLNSVFKSVVKVTYLIMERADDLV
jgi:hypothetical protein